MKTFKKLIDIFKKECDYSNINEYSSIRLRHRKNGISLPNALYYRLSYTLINSTKEEITSNLNMLNGTFFSRQAYDQKENNIPVETYYNIFNEIRSLHNKFIALPNDDTIIAVDGTYNNDNQNAEMLNIGILDITNNIPIDLKSYGPNGKNREIKSVTDYIMNDPDKFQNAIIVADRAYFSYNFLDFLDSNGIRFIIRAKGNALNLDTMIPLKTNILNRDKIVKLRENIRIAKCKNTFGKTIYAGKSKRNFKKHVIRIKNDCVLVTNIKDNRKYPNYRLLDIYKSRWDIEVFFKYLKGNFKFQTMKECDKGNYEKMYLCELIISYIVRMVEHYYKRDKKDDVKINKTNLTKGILHHLLCDILNGTLTDNGLNAFCKRYIVKIKNDKNRSFPRTSKIPFKKWYIKGYSDMTKYNKVINAIINGSTSRLNKNLKTLAGKIVLIDGKKYG